MPLLYDFSPIDLNAKPISQGEMIDAAIMFKKDGTQSLMSRLAIFTIVSFTLNVDAIMWLSTLIIAVFIALVLKTLPNKKVRLAGGHCPITDAEFSDYVVALTNDLFSKEVEDYVIRMNKAGRSRPTKSEMAEFIKHIRPTPVTNEGITQ